MANLNKVFLLGNLTRDPQLRYTPSGTPVCEFGVAVNRRFKTKEGEQRDETCFVDVAAWGRTGEVISEYFSKGKPILIEGRLKFDSWESPDGRRSKLTVVAENFQFIGARGDREGGPPRGERPSDRGDRPRAAPREEQAPGAPGKPQEPEQEGSDVSEDEIPF